jgi:hypothetical protein
VTPAEARFTDWVREHHGFDPVRLVPRPELDGGGFAGFTAVAPPPGLSVRGLVSDDAVLTFAVPGAFEAWLAAVDFARAARADADAVRFGQVRQALEAPSASSRAEAVIPLLYAQQVESAPAEHLAEPVEPPRLRDHEGGGRSVELWFQLEPGSRFEHWTFLVSGANGLTVERRPARER